MTVEFMETNGGINSAHSSRGVSGYVLVHHVSKLCIAASTRTNDYHISQPAPYFCNRVARCSYANTDIIIRVS